MFLWEERSSFALRTSLPALSGLSSYNSDDTCATRDLPCFPPSACHYYLESLIALDVHSPSKGILFPIKVLAVSVLVFGWI